MKKSKKSKDEAKKLGVNPDEVDFTLDEKELEDVSAAGNPPICAIIGYGNPNCTQTGISSPDTETT